MPNGKPKVVKENTVAATKEKAAKNKKGKEQEQAPVSVPETNGATKERDAKPVKAAKPPKKREVIYPEPFSEVRAGDKALTIEDIKEIMGHTEDPKEAKAKGCAHPLYTAWSGKDVFCTNNSRNRFFSVGWAMEIAQDHLKREFMLNGEAIIIDRTGEVLSAQHRLIGALLAEELRQGLGPVDQSAHWKEYWDGPITMETFVSYGIDGSERVTRTLDRTRPRTLADVVYSSKEFNDLPQHERRVPCKMLDNAVKLLWGRTGADLNPFAPRRTHSEAIDWINRHPKVKEAVRFVYNEYKSDWVNNCRIFPAGYAAAMLYLFAACQTDGLKYRQGDPPRERMGKHPLVDFSMWDKACEFWVMLASDSPEMKTLRTELAAFNDPTQRGTNDERMAMVTKAWLAFTEGKTLDRRAISIKSCYVETPAGEIRFVSPPSCGGIDIDEAEEKQKDKEKNPKSGGTEPTPEEIEQRKQAEREAKIQESERKQREAKDAELKKRREERAKKKGLAALPTEEERREEEALEESVSEELEQEIEENEEEIREKE